MKLTIVIPNWNGLDWLADCLDAALAQTVPAHVIVVDNGSRDGSVELVRNKYPQVQLIERDKNYGFTGGVIPGVEVALHDGSEGVALLNNDAVPAADWLEKLAGVLEKDPKVGVVTAKIRHFDSAKLDSTGDFYSIWGLPFPRGRDEMDTGQYDAPDQRQIFAGSGGVSLYRVAMLQQIGNFDQHFFAYYEDVDVSFRAWLAGWTVRYEASSVVRHRINATSARLSIGGQSAAKVATVSGPSAFARFHSVKNFCYVYTKNMPGWLYWKYLPRFWASWALMLASDTKRGLIGANLKANFTALVNLPAMLGARWQIQSKRKVSVAEIDSLLYRELPPLQKQRLAEMRRRA